jgi:hypothetical protein
VLARPVVILQSTITCLLLSLSMTAPSAAQSCSLPRGLPVGFSELLKLRRPTGDIIIGNPEIASASVQSEQVVVIAAKKPGYTNIIILDKENNLLCRASFNVFVPPEAGRVEIYPQIKREQLHDFYAYICPPSGGLCRRFKDPFEDVTRVLGEREGPLPPPPQTNVNLNNSSSSSTSPGRGDSGQQQ